MPSDSTKTPIISQLATDPEMRELVEDFVRELPAKAAILRQNLVDNDIQALSHLAHQLKGSAGGYGFPTITEAARQLEQTAKASSDLALMEAQIREIADLCQRATAQAPGT